MRHGRLEAVRNPDGTFHLRLKAANGRILMHSEQLTGRQVRRAKVAALAAMIQAYGPGVERDSSCCAACKREYGGER